MVLFPPPSFPKREKLAYESQPITPAAHHPVIASPNAPLDFPPTPF